MTDAVSEPLLLLGDCLDRLREMDDCSVDSVVTDPPYGLSFMGKKWDYDVPSEEIWRECLRVLKPGGHLLAFAGTRTQHRMAVRIEDAGFEIRDMIAWVYGSGFPKSLDVSKAIDKAAGAKREVVGSRKLTGTARIKGQAAYGATSGRSEDAYQDGSEINDTLAITAPATDAARQWQGWNTALKPALEPVTVARKPLGEKTVAANVLAHGTGAINVDGCRVGTDESLGRPLSARPEASSVNAYNWSTRPNPQAGQFLDNTGGLGRWPANLIHDGSDEVVGLFPETKNGGQNETSKRKKSPESIFRNDTPVTNYAGDSGSAARYFYCAKASKKDRDEGLVLVELRNNMRVNGPRESEEAKHATKRANFHPTVKPTELMRYLCRLVTPPEGIVLDPFMGSGSTGKAAVLEGFQFIGIERDEEYMKIAESRIAAAVKSAVAESA